MSASEINIVLMNQKGKVSELSDEWNRSVAYGEAWSKALDQNTESLEINAEQLKEVTELNQSMLSIIGDVGAAEENYQDKAVSLNEDRIKIENERAAAIAAGWWSGSEKIRDYDAALAENSRKTQENKDEFQKANLEILSGLVERKLMQDGVLTDDEFNWLIEKREAWGLYSAETVANARAVWQEADRITASINSIPDQKNTTITTFFQSIGDPQAAPGGYGYGHGYTPHASGGSFMIPPSYGNEGFKLGGGDTASGGERLTVTPQNESIIDYSRLEDAIVSGMSQALQRYG
jgi:hypothetical protein